MKSPILLLVFACFSLTSFAQLPYNPDSNNDQVINSGDLTSFLAVFGQSSFLAEGVVQIENGGTSASSFEEARLNLDISLFADSSMLIDGVEVPFGWVEGGFRATGNVAMGSQTVATGDFSTAEGSSTTASGNFSHAQNRLTTASGTCAHAEGEGGIASGTAAHVEGFGCISTNVGSHAEGYQTDALQFATHAEGYQTTAQGQYSHAEGRNTLAAGTSSHAEGQNSSATGLISHAEGNFTQASGDRSHAGGFYTVADQPEQTAIGRFNQLNQTGALLSVGNGASQVARSDAFRVMSDGTVFAAGNLELNGAVISEGQNLNEQIATLQAENEALSQQLATLQALVDGLLQGLQAPSQD